MVICGQCQSQNSPKAKFCVQCGVGLLPTQELAVTEAAHGSGAPKENASAPASAHAVTSPQIHESSPLVTRETGQNEITERADAAVMQTNPGEPQGGAAPSDLVEGLIGKANEIEMQAAEIEPLLAEEARIRIADDQLNPLDDPPLRLSLNFPRAMVAGYGSIIEAKLENLCQESLEHLSVVLESNGLGESVEAIARHIGPDNWTRQQVEVSPAKAGNYVLRCNVKSLRAGQAYAFRGTVPITINVVPDNSNFTVNISDIQCVRGDGANRGLGAEFAPVNISNLVPTGAIRTLNDLLNVSFPESYGKVPLELDYEVSQVAMERHIAPNNTAWSIPKPFLGHVQSGTKLRLEPVEEVGKKSGPAIHLIARAEFRLGRSRQEADFLTWFWPRSTENDERTKRLSKVHVVAEGRASRLFLRDAGSANRSTFEGHALGETENGEIDQRGTLILGNEYHVDVTPFRSTLSGDLQIANERTWSGPPKLSGAAVRGSVRFMPVNSEVALYNAVWLFTDANFGCSRLNAVVLDVPGAAEVEGRFYYYRGNFWVETLSTGNGIIVNDYQLRQRDVVPLVNGTKVKIAGRWFGAAVEP